MGTPIPPPFVPSPVSSGSACPRCWGVGQPFGTGQTPEKIFLTFSGVNKAPGASPLLPEFPNGLHVLDQVVGTPCKYTLLMSRGTISVEWSGLFSTCQLDAFGFTILFLDISLTLCESLFFNLITENYIGGSALIEIPEVE